MATGSMGTVDSKFVLNHTVDDSAEKSIEFVTQNKFLDKNIVVKIAPQSTGTILFEATNNTAIDVTVNTTPSGGKYELTAQINGKITPTQGGWLAAGPTSVSDNSVMVGKIAQSNFTSTTVTPNVSNTTAVTIPAGYYHAARTVTVNAMSSGQKASVTSGTANITSIAAAYNSTNDNFTITGQANVSAPTINTAGYISSSDGNKNAKTNGAQVNATLPKIVGSTTITGTTTKKPVISKQATPDGVTNAASDDATTITPSSGVYVAVKSAANTGTLTATPTVTTAGYGDATNNGITGNTATVGASASDTAYVPITTTSVTATTHATAANNKVTWGSGWISSGTISAGSVVLSGSTNATTPTATVTNTAGTGSAVNVGSGLSASTSKPSAGYFVSFNATAPATTNITPTKTVTKGYLGNASQITGSVTVNSAVKEHYVVLPTAGFSVSGGAITATTAGYVASGTQVGNVNAGAMSASASDPGTGYAENTTVVLQSEGWLKMTAGYYGATKIQLATLIGDNADILPNISGESNVLLAGYKAYDDHGRLLSGSIGTYTGSYEVT